ncbi:recombination protein rad52 [Xylariales sp. AK1849]|nr:recombination protein rad52 [Xylariales sp. AK1849]
MPAPGDQHNSIANPFEETKPRISEFTATEIATLQSRLEKQLGPEYLSARSGPSGQKVHYIAAEKCIALANDVFGFNGWSSSIQNIQVDFVDENPQTLKISLGLSVIVRVTLRDGTFHEDIGYGHIENCKGKAAAFEKAKKEGTTDALKRALRNFGNVLGNCIYDKDYLAKVTKMKVAPTKFDEGNLHRHSDFAKTGPEVKVEARTGGEKNANNSLLSNNSMDALDEDFGDFDMADFGVTEDGHPDEVVLPGPHEVASFTEKAQTLSSGNGSDSSKTSTNSASGPLKHMQPPPRAPMARSGSNGQPHLNKQPQTPNQPANRPGRPNSEQQQQGRPHHPVNGPPPAQVSAAQQTAAKSRTNTPPPALANANKEPEGPVGFFSARSVKALPESAPPGTAAVAQDSAKPFDPYAESPSIRKTPGIDHRTTKPLARNGQHVAPAKRDEEVMPPHPAVGFSSASGTGPSPGPNRQSLGNVVNPAVTHTRQIGAPGGHSPMGNRGQYRPLTVKRPAPGGTDGGTRPPLNEVSANGHVGAVVGDGGGVDAKRQKTS